MQKILSGCLAMTMIAMLSGCGEKGGKTNVASSENELRITESNWGTSPDGKEVKAFTLTNANGMKAVIIEFGGILHELHVPDKDGNLADVVLGCDTIEGYDTVSPNFSALTGRCAMTSTCGMMMRRRWRRRNCKACIMRSMTIAPTMDPVPGATGWG